ncbi:MAG: CBS domain-containing protein [Planctomycetes bacterium]|nr:CBS domain-containing protein [Planctomycetota bacterium]
MKKLVVSDIMSRLVVTVERDTPIETVVGRMAAENIGAAVIVDRDFPIGIFTERDALKRVLSKGVDGRAHRIDSVMTPKFVYVAPSDSLYEVCRKMHIGNFRHLPVVEQGKMVGMLSIRDLLGSFMDATAPAGTSAS